MNKQKLTVTIATSAYNEKGNIFQFLESVTDQKEEMIVIKKILVVSDASTDETAQIAKNYKDRRIVVVTGKRRLGKPGRMNQILNKFNTDVVVFIDTDVILNDDKVIERLVCRFIKDPKLGLASGNPQPILAKTFIESAINNYFYARNRQKSNYNFASSGQAAHGRIIAYSKHFAEKILLPNNILGDDGFSLLKCKEFGFHFHYEDSAIVWYRSPNTLRDYIKQATRFLAGHIQLYDFFNKDIVDQAYSSPPTLVNLKILIFQLKNNPIGYIILKILNIYAAFKASAYLDAFDIRWTPAFTSKQLLSKRV